MYQIHDFKVVKISMKKKLLLLFCGESHPQPGNVSGEPLWAATSIGTRAIPRATEDLSEVTEGHSEGNTRPFECGRRPSWG
jgi:hypothetical protein